MTPSWYDVLGVAPDASGEEIRAAWQSAIADREPGDRRFQAANRAAEVLLDPERRASYDAEQTGATTPSGAAGTGTAVAAAPAPSARRARPSVRERAARLVPRRSAPKDPASPADTGARTDPAAPTVTHTGATGRRTVPAWLLVLVGVLALAVIGGTAYAWAANPADEDVRGAASAAQAAAEEALGPVLSYDATTLQADREEALRYLTDDFGAEYEKFFDGLVAENAPELGTRVEARVLGSGVVRTGAGGRADSRVQVLVLVDQYVTNKQQSKPTAYRNHVTVTMAEVDGEWLVDELSTTSAGG